MKLTRKQFIGSIISSVAALASFGASSDTHKKGQLHLNGGTHKLKKLVLGDDNFIKGPGTIEIDGPDAILVAGRNVTIDNVVFKTTIGPSKQSSIIKMLEGCSNLIIRNCHFSGNAYCVLKADVNTNEDKDLTYKNPVGPLLFRGNTCFGFSRHLFLSNVTNLNIEGNVFEKSVRDSIRLRQAVKKVIISKNQFNNIGVDHKESSDAIDTYWSGEELVINSNIVDGCAVHGFDLKGISPDKEGSSSKVIVDGNIIKNCKFSGLLISSGMTYKHKSNMVTDIIIKANIITNCNLNNANPNDAAIFLRHGVQGCIITQNKVTINNGHAVVIGNFDENAKQTKDITIVENQLKATKGMCLYLLAPRNIVVARNILQHSKNMKAYHVVKSFKKFKLAKFIEIDNLESVINDQA